MGKYIIALIAPNETGKTTVVKTFWKKFSKGSVLNGHKKYETIGYWDDSKIRKRIGVNSLGDTKNQIQEGLAVLLFHQCDIIICTARSVDALIKAKDNLDKSVFECHLDDSISISSTDLNKYKTDLKGFTIITLGHFSEVCERISLTERDRRKESHNPVIGGLNLNEFTSEMIMELIKKIS